VPVADRARLTECVAAVAGTKLSDAVAGYIVGIIRATRNTPDLSYGASPRSGAMLAAAARAHAALDGRDYVIPDDVKALVLPALRHRVVLSPAAEIDGRKADEIIRTVVEAVEAPR
jgi:MoxR-like ATPase